jgi:hypothetical protein
VRFPSAVEEAEVKSPLEIAEKMPNNIKVGLLGIVSKAAQTVDRVLNIRARLEKKI